MRNKKVKRKIKKKGKKIEKCPSTYCEKCECKEKKTHTHTINCCPKPPAGRLKQSGGNGLHMQGPGSTLCELDSEVACAMNC